MFCANDKDPSKHCSVTIPCAKEQKKPADLEAQRFKVRNPETPNTKPQTPNPKA